MPFTPQELQEAGVNVLDNFLKNDPIDQIKTERPLLKALNGRKKTFGGAKQFIVEQLRFQYSSIMQAVRGAQTLNYNRRHINAQAQYEWTTYWDGYYLEEDRLAQHGIIVNDTTKPRSSSQAERIQLANLFDEMNEALKLGSEEKFHAKLWKAGTEAVDDIVGIDAIVSLNPTNTVGGIDRSVAANAWWKNVAFTGLTSTPNTGDINDKMELARRQIAIHKPGSRPTIFAGSAFIDAYKNFHRKSWGQANWSMGDSPSVDGAVSDDNIKFMGIPITWVPDFDTNFGAGGADDWTKRCYMLDMSTIKLRPMEENDWIARYVPRPHDQLVWFFGTTWRGGLTCNQCNANAVLKLA